MYHVKAMGICSSIISINVFNPLHTISKTALKLPHGKECVVFSEKTGNFEKQDSIDSWLSQEVYSKKEWTNWVIYNDETEKLGDTHTKKGHCKGIVAWNEKSISWLCHSVPNFPRTFTSNSISPLEDSELIYGQSFQYVEIPFTVDMISGIMKQLQIMHAHVFKENYTDFSASFHYNSFHDNSSYILINELVLSDTVTHVAKSPSYEIDIYSDFIAGKYPTTWYVETWIRGHHIEKSKTIKDVTNLKYDENHTYTEQQDHSKWATTNDKSGLFWVGDLNRMTSQFTRGGGGFLCMNRAIADSLFKLVVDP
jgi:deoxyribonuclease-2